MMMMASLKKYMLNARSNLDSWQQVYFFLRYRTETKIEFYRDKVIPEKPVLE